jgi:uncharacterized small protein (DUF1192 family)
MDLDELFPGKPADPLAQLVKQDLDPLSVEELEERIATLEGEIARVRAKMDAAVNHRASAEALFKFCPRTRTDPSQCALGSERRRHEYATLEHLLLALIDDAHASKVMTACGVDLRRAADAVKAYLDNELEALKVDGHTDPSPTSGFQRVVQRAILHVQSSGRDEVTGANVLVALFSERESYAVYFLQQQDMSRSTR